MCTFYVLCAFWWKGETVGVPLRNLLTTSTVKGGRYLPTVAIIIDNVDQRFYEMKPIYFVINDTVSIQ